MSPADVELVDPEYPCRCNDLAFAGEPHRHLLVDDETPARPPVPAGPGGPPPFADPYAIPAYRHARAAIAHEPRSHYEPPPPSRLELARRSYEDALELARSIERLDLTDRARILDAIAAAWPEVVAAAIEDIARGHRYDYALELVPR